MTISWRIGWVATTFLLAGTCISAQAAEEQTVNAIAAVEGVGQLYEIAPNRALFLGGFAGTIFVEDAVGALDAAQIVCPASLDVELPGGRQAGSGHCIITNAQGSRIFARWDCEGTHTVGCKGTFELVGGTDEFTGISGESEFLIRSAIHVFAITALGGEATEAVLALVTWPQFSYQIP
jgi:hypothetical protein